MAIQRFNLLFPGLEHPLSIFSQDQIGEFVFTDCNGGVRHAEKINRLAELTFDSEFPRCLEGGALDPIKFSEVFPDETLPEESMDGFHIFDREDLNRWINAEKKRTCPICTKKVEEIVLCPYLTEKFWGRREDLLRHPPIVVKLTGEHVVNVEPSSVLQDPDSILKLFLVEMAHFMNQGIDPFAEEFHPDQGLIAWCFERDREETQVLLDVIHREKALSSANLMVLKKNPLVLALKQQIDVYLESLGPVPEERPAPGAQMQLFIQCFFGDNTNWTFFNSLMSQANVTLTYELTDLVMLPPDQKRFIQRNVNLEEVKEQARRSQIKRAIGGLIFAGLVLFYCTRRIYYSLFKSSKPISKT